MLRSILVLGVLALFAAEAGADEKKDQAALAGKWQPTSMVFGGRESEADQLKNILLTIEGDKYSVVANNVPDKGTFKLSTKDKQKTMDITGTEGPNKGQTMLCIYEIEGDNLKVCYALGGGKRPTEFKGTGEKILLITYKKQK